MESRFSIPDHEVEIFPIRAQGAGGQNVNKVSNAVHLRFDIHASSLPEDVSERLLKQYKLNLRTDEVFDGVNYQCRFHPPAGIWITCRLACSEFSPSWRGNPVPDAPPFNPAHLRQVGFMIADRQEGGFSLAIRGISVETHQE